MAKRFYPAVIEKDAKGMLAAWLPDFPDCVAAGRSQDEVLRKVEDMLATAADRYGERDAPLPEPTAVDAIVLPKGSRAIAYVMIGLEPRDPSERVNIYLPKSLIERADKRAAELGMSRSSFFGFAISTIIGWSWGIGVPLSPRSPRAKAVPPETPPAGKTPAKRSRR